MLTVIAGVAIFTHASGLWKLNKTIPVKAAIVFAIKYGTVLANVRRGTLTCTKTITNALRFSCEMHQLVIVEPTWYFSFIYTIMTAMCTMLIVITIVLTNCSWAGNV